MSPAAVAERKRDTRSQAVASQQESGYRWVMAAVCGLVMTISFISLMAYGVATSEIAEPMHVLPQT